MRRRVGIAILAASAAAAVVLLATGHLVSVRVVSADGGRTPTGSWDARVYAVEPNVWAVAPLAAAFLAGLLCVVAPRRPSA